MFFLYGTQRYGKVDRIPGKSHIATMFFHINFVPLIPMYSLEISEDPDDDGGARHAPFSPRSVLVAWGNCVLLLSVVMTPLMAMLLPFAVVDGKSKVAVVLCACLFAAAGSAWCVALYYGLSWVASPDPATQTAKRRKNIPVVTAIGESIVMACPICKEKVRLSGAKAGKRVRCEYCQELIRVPGAEESTEDDFAGDSGSLLTKLIIGGGVCVGLILVIAGLFFLSVLTNQVANQPPKVPIEDPKAWRPKVVFPNRQQIPQTPMPNPQLPATPAPGNPAPQFGSNETRQFGSNETNPPQSDPPSNTPSPDQTSPPFGRRSRRMPSSRTNPSPPDGFPQSGPPGTVTILPATPMRQNAVKSALAGGAGGVPFERGLNGMAMVGVDWRQGRWAGTPVIGAIFPIASAGRPNPGCQQVTAPAGYVVGGINAYAPQFVNNIQLVYMKLRDDGTLDPDDTKLSEWLGGKPKGEATSLTGAGKKVIGLYGRGTAVVDAIGLLTEQ